MRHLISNYFVLLVFTIPFLALGQVSDENDDDKSCEVFNPSVYESPEREVLRTELLSLFGPLKGKDLLDIGAGAGYFAFEYAKSARNVVATELNDQLIDYMIKKKRNLGLSNLSVVEGSNDFSELKGKSFDIALMVDVYHELNDPKAMLPILKNSMKANGRIVIVESHLSPIIVTDYLEMAGFSNTKISKFSYDTQCGLAEVNIISADNNTSN